MKGQSAQSAFAASYESPRWVFVSSNYVLIAMSQTSMMNKRKTTSAIFVLLLICACDVLHVLGLGFASRSRHQTRPQTQSRNKVGWKPMITHGMVFSLSLYASHPDDGCSDDAPPGTTQYIRSEMEDLIVSLSLEPTDASRRERLASIFAKELSKPDDAPKAFAATFDAALQTIGNEVQIAARENALWKRAAVGGDDDAEDVGSSVPSKSRDDDDDAVPMEDVDQDYMHSGGKNAEEQQLWALVDMMVQSKTLVKRTEGNLGSGGAFS